MDKYEYKLRAEEMKDLIGRKEYAEAMAIADTIDWRRVKNVTMLTMVSDLYKINRRYDASRDMLLLAYDRYPGGRTIVYSLCELSIKLGEFVQAVEYYKEFVRVAPNDSGRYILKYKIYDAQEVSLEERIRVLEEFKEIDYREKWGYELAFLYHRAGLERQCVAECDELIITFGEGKYVIKAMELKMLHQPLTPVQQERYDNRNKKNVTEAPSARQKASLSAKTQEDERYAQSPNGASERQGMTEIGQQGAAAPGSDTEMDIHVRTLDLGNKYNTLNIQAALADSMKELMAKDALEAEAQRKQQARERARQAEQARLEQERLEQERLEQERLEQARLEQERLEQERLEQERLEQARLEQERLEQERLEQERFEQERLEQERLEQERLEQARLEQERFEQARLERARLEKESRAQRHAAEEDRALTFDPNSMDAASIVQNMAERAALTAESRYDEILAMENDGQISLVVPEQSRVEKQITGQLSIEEVLREWERMKRASDQKSMDNLKQRVLQQTGEMFTAFDKSTKSGLLEGLEDENSSLSHLPIQPEEPKPRPKTEAELFADSVLKDEGLEGEDLPEVEELIEIDDYSETGELDSAGIAASAENLPQDEAPQKEDQTAQEPQAGEPQAQEPQTGEPQAQEPQAGAPQAQELQNEGPQKEEPEAETAQKTSDIEYVVDTGMMQTIMGVSETPDKEEAPAQEQQPDGDTQRLEAAIIEAEMEERNAIRQSAEKARAERAAQKPVPENDGFNTREIMSVSDKLIENAEREVRGESEKEQTPARALTEDEKELFGALIQTEQMKHQIAAAIDKVSLAAYTGNVIITGENGSGTMTLAKNLIKNVQISDNNFSGRIARISGAALDKKDIPATLSKLRNGALIVEKANGMSADSLKKLTQYLEQEHEGIIVILEDTKIEMRKCLNKNPSLEENFNARIDINAMDNDALVAYAKEYAYEKEYSIDDLGVLALYTRISDLQTGDHNVTLGEVREIIDEAVWSANRKSPKHFVDILSGKRYDNEDMIVLREKDFIC